MQTRTPVARLVHLLSAAMIVVTIALSAHAQETSYNASFARNKEAVPVNVLVGQSRVINFDRDIGRFSVSNPEIAEAVLVAPNQVIVNGKAFGQVNFIAWEQAGGGQFLVFDVFVRANLSLIDSQMRALLSERRHTLTRPTVGGHLRVSLRCEDGRAGPGGRRGPWLQTVTCSNRPSRTRRGAIAGARCEGSRNRLKDVHSFNYQGSRAQAATLIAGSGQARWEA